MRVVHLADTHLGFRQFHVLSPAGINQREADVAAAFRSAITQTIALDPDVVVIAGDVFHHVRPSNVAAVFAVQQMQRLMRTLPHTAVVVIAGNHDAPRATDTGSILPLFSTFGAHVVLTEPQRVTVGDLSILCVPDTGVPRSHVFETTPSRYNLLLLHGEIAGTIAGARPRADDIDASALGEAWDYIALGHYHVQQQVAPRAWYAGSLEYTSSNPWGEIAGASKGFLEVDLATGTVTPHQVQGVRQFIDLPRLSAGGLTAEPTMDAIRERVTIAPVGAVVRQVVTDCEPEVARALRGTFMREIRRAGMLHVHLDVRRAEEPVRVRMTQRDNRSLAEMLADALMKRAEVSGIPADRLLDAGARYLAAAEDTQPERVALTEAA